MRSRLSMQTISEVAELTQSGVSRADVCRHIGITRRTFKRWLSVGRARTYGDGDGTCLYSILYQRYREARTRAKRELLQMIRVAALKDWKAAAYLLERLDKETINSVNTQPIAGCVTASVIAAARELISEGN